MFIKNIKYLWVYVGIGILLLSILFILLFYKSDNSQNDSISTTTSTTPVVAKNFMTKLMDTLYPLNSSQNVARAMNVNGTPITPQPGNSELRMNSTGALQYTAQQLASNCWKVSREFIPQDILSQITCNDTDISYIIMCIIIKMSSKILNIQNKNTINIDDTEPLKNNNDFFNSVCILLLTHLMKSFSRKECLINYDMSTDTYIFAINTDNQPFDIVFKWNKTKDTMGVFGALRRELQSIKEMIKSTPSPTTFLDISPAPSWFRDIINNTDLENMSMIELGKYVFLSNVWRSKGKYPQTCNICPVVQPTPTPH